jgi:ribonuclease HI
MTPILSWRTKPRPSTPPSTRNCHREWGLYTDAALSGTNPLIGIGIYLTHNDQPWYKEATNVRKSDLQGTVTSTIAEYVAGTRGLRIAKSILPATVTKLYHYSDNQAVSEQANGNWHTTSTATLHAATQYRLLSNEVTFQVISSWIPRSDNAMADHLAAMGAKGNIGVIPVS